MNISETHKQIVDSYSEYIRSFINISDPEIQREVEQSLDDGELWPEPLLQFNPAYETTGSVEKVIESGLLHHDVKHIFKGYSLYRHQCDALQLGIQGRDFVVTSGTGSGKSLTYIGTIFNHLLTYPETAGVTAVIVYPMNALINSQTNEFNTYKDNYEKSTGRDFPISYHQYTSQEPEEQRQLMREHPPQILLINYMMLELLLTRVQDRPIRDAIFKHLRYLVFDELHTYRGRQGADVSLLIRRIRSHCQQSICCIGTSATMVSVDDSNSHRKDVARTASTIFGKPFREDQIVEETLQTSTGGTLDQLPSKSELYAAINDGIQMDPDQTQLCGHPIIIWLERRIALEIQPDGSIIRRRPMGFNKVIEVLSEDSGHTPELCQQILEKSLQWISMVNKGNEKMGEDTVLPYKLHQFIAQTGSVYTTLDQGEGRYITLLKPGIYKHDDRSKPIFPNVFSRTTGHPFICVSLAEDQFIPREFRSSGDEDLSAKDGYLIVGDDIWDSDQDRQNLPSAWFQTRAGGRIIVHPDKKDEFPQKYYFDETGKCSQTTPMKYWGWFMKAPLLFDPTGGVFFDNKTNEGTKLTPLGSEGRSTSTTTLSFLILKHLHASEYSLQDQKLLSFTDNRQDAALQSGHFNDFIQVVRLRSAIYHALKTSKNGTLDYATLGDAIFTSLDLPFRDYGNRDAEPELAQVKKEYDEAFSDYLFYRALEDLRRSWRIVLPNLEQCALVQIDYKNLDDIVAEDSFWSDVEIVNRLNHAERKEFLTAILEYFRLEFAIHSENYLTRSRLKKSEKDFREKLKKSWSADRKEELSSPYVLRLETLHKRERFSHKSMGSRSSFGKYIMNYVTNVNLNPDDFRGQRYNEFILQLIRKLKDADYLFEDSALNTNKEKIPVFRLRIEKILWKLGDEKTVRLDPIKSRSYKEHTRPPNAFFQKVYSENYAEGKRLIAADHTGQLSVSDRQKREECFRADWYVDDSKKILDESRIRSDSISALYCSPTMELGVDIGGLTVVHMRNVPPNASNYVQRSGRAGRSGQGALIFTYCSGFAPHDRHYFKNQVDMVAGIVQAPRIDILNQELLRSHLHALMISTTGLPGLDHTGGNKSSLMRLVDENHSEMPLSPSVEKGLKLGPEALKSIKSTFLRAIEDFSQDLESIPNTWYSDGWIDRNLREMVNNLDKALERWRKLYYSARSLLTRATQSIESGLLKVGSDEYRRYKRQMDQANRQLNLLRNDRSGYLHFSEFYPYRYLAAEGFLPGYNFTRLPLRIFIPTSNTSGEYISRSREVALREYGPQNMIYYNGSKYRITYMVVQDAESSLIEMKINRRAGYCLMNEQSDLEICPFSGVNLSDADNTEYLHHLIEMTESRGEERERITCQEEERLSRGYDIESFLHVDGGNFERIREAMMNIGESHLLTLRFIPTARLIHVNRGWKSRQAEGFPFGMTSGRWRTEMPKIEEENTEECRLVKLWTSNLADALYIDSTELLELDRNGIVTLQYALKRAIESVFQVESSEIGVTEIGDPESPRILIYEAAEGSLGILSQFVDDPAIFRRIIQEAATICQYDDESYKAPASYDDLLSYYNQRDHQRIDRFLIRDTLTKLTDADLQICAHGSFRDYDQQYHHLLNHIDPNSSTERVFIDYLYKNGLRLPDDTQKRVPGIYCQPDFYYEPRIWIFCDGSPHDDPQVREHDEKQRHLINARGDEVWSWHYREDLAARVAERPDIFRKIQ